MPRFTGSVPTRAGKGDKRIYADRRYVSREEEGKRWDLATGKITRKEFDEWKNNQTKV